MKRLNLICSLICFCCLGLVTPRTCLCKVKVGRFDVEEGKRMLREVEERPLVKLKNRIERLVVAAGNDGVVTVSELEKLSDLVVKFFSLKKKIESRFEVLKLGTETVEINPLLVKGLASYFLDHHGLRKRDDGALREYFKRVIGKNVEIESGVSMKYWWNYGFIIFFFAFSVPCFLLLVVRSEETWLTFLTNILISAFVGGIITAGILWIM